MSSDTKYIIGIDASRCRSGGAYAHLIGIVSNLKPENFGIEKIHIWSHSKMLKFLPDYAWLIKHNPLCLEKGLYHQVFWQAVMLSSEVKKYKCDILFTADASTACRFTPQVVLSQDMLSYEPGIMQKHKWGQGRLRLQLILWLQNAAFRHASGVIFLTRYASEVIQRSCGKLSNISIIPHGVGTNFKSIIRNTPQFSNEQPISCLYISNTALYKHQWHVVSAIELLRSEGIDIELTLVGGGFGKAQKMLENQIALSDPDRSYVKQVEFVPQNEIAGYLSKADIFVFASGCENMPITLIEAMAAGLPIACSNKGPMPEVLNGAGVYFDPENPKEIAQSIKTLIEDKEFREQVANKSKEIAQKYSWSRCADETFSFVVETIEKLKNE